MPKSRKSKRPKLAEEETVFTVEKIIKKKVADGKTFYFLKWQNYSDAENTWEPEENLSCPALIEAFERQWAEKQKTNSSSETGGAGAAATSSASNTTGGGGGGGGGGKSKKLKKVSAASDTSVLAAKQSKAEVETPQEDELSNGGENDQEVKMPEQSGFSKGWIADDIMGATEENGQVLFLIKWYVGISLA